MQQLLENLFRNAVEHDGDAITICVPAYEGEFAIEDDGSGIPADERDAIFDDGYTTGENGTGLGLTIVEEIAAAHEWNVSVTERAAGGACFEFIPRQNY